MSGFSRRWVHIAALALTDAYELRHLNLKRRHNAMSSTTDLTDSIRESESGLTLAELLSAHPDMAKREVEVVIVQRSVRETGYPKRQQKSPPGKSRAIK
ncbi:MAG: hypothetical protein K9J77_07430 [Rhodoferax sp.]|nr:hypothetical protein [Rhodoferax sp.]